MISELRFRRGDSFDLVLDRVSSTGAPIDVSAQTVSAELLSPAGALILSLSVAKPGPNNRVSITATPAQTATWPIGNNLLRVRESQGTYTRTSEDAIIRVAEAYQ